MHGGSNAKQAFWQRFKRYHYLAGDFHQSARLFFGTVDGEPICMTGVMQQMCAKGIKRAHRFVVLPEWQGIGIGMAFIEQVADIIKKEGFTFRIITTTPQLVPALHKHKDKWCCIFSGRQTGSFKDLADRCIKLKRHSTSEHRLTATFVYRG